MQIHALDFGSNIKITMEKENKKFEFTVKVCDVDEEILRFMSFLSQRTLVPFVFIDLNEENKELVSLYNAGWCVTVDAVVRGTHYAFTPEAMYQITFRSGKTYLVVFDINNEEASDRRLADRVAVGVDGWVFSWRYREPIRVIVKDVSFGGLGLILDSSIDCMVGDEIKVIIPSNGVPAVFSAKVVRVNYLDNGHNMVGCVL